MDNILKWAAQQPGNPTVFSCQLALPGDYCKLLDSSQIATFLPLSPSADALGSRFSEMTEASNKVFYLLWNQPPEGSTHLIQAEISTSSFRLLFLSLKKLPLPPLQSASPSPVEPSH